MSPVYGFHVGAKATIVTHRGKVVTTQVDFLTAKEWVMAHFKPTRRYAVPIIIPHIDCGGEKKLVAQATNRRYNEAILSR